MGKTYQGKVLVGKLIQGKVLVGKTLFHEKLFEGKVLRQNFLRKLIGKTSAPKTSIAEKFPGRKLFIGENFLRKTFTVKLLSRKLPPEFPVTHKNYPGRKKGEPSRKRKTLDGGLFLNNDDFEDTRDTPPDSIVQRKSPQRLRTLLRSRKTFPAKLIFRKTFWSKLIFQKTSSARRQSPC